MYRLVRVMLIAVAPALLTGCGTSGGVFDSANSLTDSLSDMVHDFNPLGTSKKPLPGERRAVFPEGVPGVQQGVPADMVRRNQPPPPQTAAMPQQSAVASDPDDDATPAAAPAAQSRATKTVRRARSTTAIEPRSSQPRQSQPQAEDDVWPPLPKQ